MRQSHAVVWAIGEATPNVGRLEIGPAGVRLVGSTGHRSVECVVPVADMTGVHVAREGAERVNGLRAIVLDTVVGSPVRIAAVAGAGAILEIAQAVGRLLEPGSRPA